METKRKSYYIPPRLDRSYLLAGFTVVEMLLFLVLAFAGGYIALKGAPAALAAPAVMLVLHCRVFPDGKNVKQMIVLRWRFFRKEQSYGLQECGNRKGGRKP